MRVDGAGGTAIQGAPREGSDLSSWGIIEMSSFSVCPAGREGQTVVVHRELALPERGSE